MKKTLLIVGLVVLALGALGVGVVVAQGQQPPQSGFGPGMMLGGEEGPLHDYMIQAMADAVGLPVNEFESRHDAGETFYQIAQSQGISTDKLATLMQDARTKALNAAVADGVLTQEQADWMGSRGFGRGGMMGGYGYGQGQGYGNGDCPMFDGDETPNTAPNSQPGSGYGPGMMRNWGGQY